MDQTVQLLKALTEAHGVPGYEAPVRALIREALEPLGHLSEDRLGSVICRKDGTSSSPKVMLAAHMDEVGFMVKHITPEGFIKFLPLGGWFDQVLLGQRVIIKTRKGDVVGVIGAKPPHILPPDERNKVVPKKDMFIDIGATSKAEVEEAGVRPGDPVVPRADFVVLANGKSYLSKAFDDRVGVAVMIEALQALQERSHPNTIYATATVQEEIGLRGAQTSVWAVEPDVAIILESDIAGDIPGVKAEQAPARLGKGPSLLIYERRMVPNLALRDLFLETAKEIGVNVQMSFVEGGGTDGAAIQLHRTGVPVIVLSVPARHIHSHSAIIHRDDFDQAVQLLVAVLQRLDAETVAALTR
ncbi:MAG: M42 family metallopeptidase [Chloroflexi bacterium]|nr:M42 family metallopeptidase [Chloroflexota bacterium]